MKLLKNVTNIEAFRAAVRLCKGDVILCSADGRETFNLKSTLSEYMAIAELAKDHGDEWEIFCLDKSDEQYMLKFFNDLVNN